MARKLYIKTFGCQMNEYDSSRMADALSASHGLATVDCADDADVLLLNTCSIREKAQEKGFSQVEVRADSELVVKQMLGQYKVKNPRLKPLWNQARYLADKFNSFAITHVPREGNARADELANEALDREGT